jgi:hypothetical protein
VGRLLAGRRGRRLVVDDPVASDAAGARARARLEPDAQPGRHSCSGQRVLSECSASAQRVLSECVKSVMLVTVTVVELWPQRELRRRSRSVETHDVISRRDSARENC